MINPKKTITKKNLTNLLLSFSLIFAFASCEQDPDDFGNDFVESQDSISVKSDSSFSLKSHLYRNDSVRTSGMSYGLIANTDDPYHGKMQAGFLTNFPYSTLYGFGSEPVADSVYLYMIINKTYDLNPRGDIEVYQLNRPLEEDKTYYSNINPAAYHYPDPISLETEYLSDDTVRIKLKPDYGDFLLQYDTNNVDTTTVYHQRVPGIYCTLEERGNKGYFAQVELNNQYSKLTVFYRNPGTEEGETESQNFPLNGNITRINNYTYDFSELTPGGDNVLTYLENDDSLASDSLLFIGSLAGTYAKFTLPEGLRTKYENNDSLLLANAELILPISEEHSEFKPTEEVKLYYYSSDTTEISAGSVDLIYEKNYYVADLTQYVHNYIKGNIDENLYLHIENNRMNPGRVTINGANHSNSIKFRVKYYKP